ncbi:class I SAM-dependent methyltransferase [Candidatus Roizmanbacteria bacterium]|nr:class I SAM-dependent methyltransferase [Candidatus Roizmanbacteria bacterium]
MTDFIPENGGRKPEHSQDYDAVAALYDERVRSGQMQRQSEDPLLQEAGKRTLDLLERELYKPDKKSIRLVELGSGRGALTRRLLASDPYFQDTSRHIDITAVDVSGISLEEYSREVPAARANTKVQAIQSTIGHAVGQIEDEIDNVVSTGVAQITPPEVSEALSALLPRLVEGGAFIFQYYPPQSGERDEGVPIQTRGLGKYFSYRYPRSYLDAMIKDIAQAQGLALEVKFIDMPPVVMRNPLNLQQMMPPHRADFLVIHRK